MKTLPLITKEIKVGDQMGSLKSKDLLLVALDSYQDGLKGIKNISLMLTIHEKIETAEDIVDLEDAEYDLLYRAIDQCQWTPIILRFKEFFETLKAK
jgi:hypothetical protein